MRQNDRQPVSPAGYSLPPEELHEPIMVREILQHLKLADGMIVVDATLGLGGHAAAILAHYPNAKVIGLDRDPGALKLARQRLAEYGTRLTTIHGNFADMHRLIPRPSAGKVDAVIMDLGISSWQLAERGFSFREDAPLDFRMDPSEGESAADLVARLPERDLADVLYRYGEEHRSRRIAKAIVGAAKEAPIDTTQRLAKVIQGVAGGRGRIHPATKSFQALRIAVNDELTSLAKGLESVEKALSPGGRVAVLTFHSLEDRVVKQHIADSPALKRLNKKVIRPAREEIGRNRRARSAKLRVAEKKNVTVAG